MKLYVRYWSKIKHIYIQVMLVLSTFISFNTFSFAGSNDIGSSDNIISQLTRYMVGISTGLVFLAAGIGMIMIKFSLGKHDRISTGYSIIRNAIFAWVLINGHLLIMKLISKH